MPCGAAAGNRTPAYTLPQYRSHFVILQGLLQCGWAVRATEAFRIKSGPAIRITTAALEPRDAIRLADDLESILRPRMRASMT